jgi:hypothetical protein
MVPQRCNIFLAALGFWPKPTVANKKATNSKMDRMPVVELCLVKTPTTDEIPVLELCSVGTPTTDVTDVEKESRKSIMIF